MRRPVTITGYPSLEGSMCACARIHWGSQFKTGAISAALRNAFDDFCISLMVMKSTSLFWNRMIFFTNIVLSAMQKTPDGFSPSGVVLKSLEHTPAELREIPQLKMAIYSKKTDAKTQISQYKISAVYTREGGTVQHLTTPGLLIEQLRRAWLATC